MGGGQESLLDGWLDLALGCRCLACGRGGRLLCRPCATTLPTAGVPVAPDPCPPGLAPVFAAAEYADPLRRLILAHKERSAVSLTRPLGRVLAEVIGTALAARSAEAAPGARPPAYRVLLAPVPSRRAVVRDRGFDPMRAIVGATASALHARWIGAAPLLCSRGPVLDQAGLDSAARAANLAGSMTVRPGSVRRLARAGVPVRVIVCDDVVTTGATLAEAQRALAAIGIPVLAFATLAATRRRRPSRAAGRDQVLEIGGSLPLWVGGG